MPLYEYECTACKRRFELIQKMSDPPAQTCPTCGGAVHKLQSAPAFQFKGTGWYVTDYARKDQTGGKAEGDSGSTADAKSSEQKGGEKGKEAGDKSSDSSKAAAPSSGSSTSPTAASSKE
jgi:putative FmdB family regulatory protein